MKKSLTTYFAHVQHLLRMNALSGSGMFEPKRDWYTMLVCTCVLMVGLGGYGAYVYHSTVRAPEVDEVAGANRRPVPDVERLSHVLGAYRERTAEFERLRGVQEAGHIQGATPSALSTTTPDVIKVESDTEPRDDNGAIELQS